MTYLWPWFPRCHSLEFSWDIVFQVFAKDSLLFGSAQHLERFVIFKAMLARSKHFAELIECNMLTAQWKTAKNWLTDCCGETRGKSGCVWTAEFRIISQLHKINARPLWPTNGMQTCRGGTKLLQDQKYLDACSVSKQTQFSNRLGPRCRNFINWEETLIVTSRK